MSAKYLIITCLSITSCAYCSQLREVSFGSLEDNNEINTLATSEDILHERWLAFKGEHNKKYETDFEERLRKKVFIENTHKVNKHNDLFEKGVVTYRIKMNKFGDMRPFEFERYMLMSNVTRVTKDYGIGITFIPPANAALPVFVDWNKAGAVTNVKDQGQCGSCWAFSATGALEGQYFRKTGHLVSLSEQQLIDCSRKYGNFGCKGGLAHTAFYYIHDNKGIDTEGSYPYQATELNCSYNPDYSGATCETVMFVHQNEQSLMQAVAHIGPISAGVYAKDFQFYSDGVHYDPECSGDLKKLNHMVLAVGYGTDPQLGEYWLIKNSWGSNWGEHGYIRLARNRGNQCGVASYACVPIV